MACLRSRAPEGQLYDYEKLLKAVGDRTVLPVAELCQSLIAEVQQFSATQEFNDDVCLVAMDVDRSRLTFTGRIGTLRAAR